MANWRYVNIHREADYYDGELLVTVDATAMEPLKRRSRYSLRLDHNAHKIKVKFPGFLGLSATLDVPRAGGDVFDVYFDLGVLENQQILTRRWGESSQEWWSVNWPAPAADLRSIGFDLNKFRSELDYILNPTSGKLYHQMKNKGITEVMVKPDGGGIFFKKLGDNDFLERIYYNEIGDAAHTTELQQIWITREAEYKLIRQFIRDYMLNRYPGLEYVGSDMICLKAAAAQSSPAKGAPAGSSGGRNITVRRTPENPACPVKLYVGFQEVGSVDAGNTYNVGLKNQDVQELMFIATTASEMKKYLLPEGSDDLELEISVSQDGKVSIYRGVSKWIIGKDGQNIIMPWFNGDKIIRELRSIFCPAYGILYKELYEKDAYLRFSAEKFGIYFWEGDKCHYIISYKDIVWNGDGQDIYVDSDVDFAQLMQFIGQVLNSDVCPGLCTVTPTSPLIRKDPASAIRPSVMTSAGKESETTRLIKERIKESFSLADGRCFELLLSGKADHIEVSVLREEADLSAHYAGTDEYDYEDVLTVKYALECDRIFQDTEKLSQTKPEECYISLEEAWERKLLMDLIRNMINDETSFGVYMEEDRIYLDPEARKRPEIPDVNDSMTTTALWCMLWDEYGEGTEFEEQCQEHPVTCYVNAEEDRLRITIMEESESGETRIREYPYAECTYDKFPEGNGWETLQMSLWQNRFERLEREEDRAELLDYLMMCIEDIPHMIVEGSSFRSRRPGEELIEVENTLTAKMMSRSVVKLFDLDGKFMDILRRSNIDRCYIAVYNDYINFLFIDNSDETVDKFTYEFTELADEEFLSGEGCFSRLTCHRESFELSEYLGEAVSQLPYYRHGYYNGGQPNYSDVYLDKSVVPGLDEPYIPEDTDIPAEPAGPAFSVQVSPTTWAIVAAMNRYFAKGGSLDRYMEEIGFDGADMTAAAWELCIGFWKNGVCSTRLSMQYKQFGNGLQGEFESLNEEDQVKLQEIVRTTVPYFDI